MMDIPKPPQERAQEIILAQMERLDKIAELWFQPEKEVDTIDLTAVSKAMAELNRELYRAFPPIAYPTPFVYPQSAD